jgi:hypothetical protein
MTPCNIKHVDQVKNQLEDAKQWAGVRDVDLVVRGKDNNIRLEARSRDKGNAKAKGLLQELIASINTQFSISGDLVERMSRITNGYTTNVNFTQKALDELEIIAQQNAKEDVKKDSEITLKQLELLFPETKPTKPTKTSRKSDIYTQKGNQYFVNGEVYPTYEDARNALETQYQLPQGREIEEYVASEKTIRDLAARMSDRIGIPVRFESDRTKKYKGKLENGTAVVNLAYATLDTPIHEILGHPIIRAIKNNYKFTEFKQSEDDPFSGTLKEEDGYSQLYQNLLKELEYGKGKEVLDRVKRDYDIKTSKYQKLEDENDINHIESVDTFKIGNDEYKYEYKEFEGYSGYYPSFTKDGREIEFEEFKQAYNKNIDSLSVKYTLEEQQEEAIVELLGLMTAEKLDNVKDGKLISLLKRFLKK